MEWAALKVIKFRLGNGYVNSRPDLDWETTGFPMPYGIDISPIDGRVWIARLYADDIAVIDPESLDVFKRIADGILLCKLVNAAEPDTIPYHLGPEDSDS